MVFFTCAEVSISFADIRNISDLVFLPIEEKYLRIIDLYSLMKVWTTRYDPCSIMCRCVPVTV